MILGVHHVQITVPKGAEEQAKAFYCGVLGLPEVAKPKSLQGRGGFWIKVGDRDVHIGTEDGFDRRTTRVDVCLVPGVALSLLAGIMRIARGGASRRGRRRPSYSP